MRYILKKVLTEVPEGLIGINFKREDVLAQDELPEYSQAFFSGQEIPAGMQWTQTTEGYPQLTEIPPVPRETIEANARTTRDSLLAQTDKYLIADYPISEDDLTKMKTYRRRLRDWPKSLSFPKTLPVLEK